MTTPTPAPRPRTTRIIVTGSRIWTHTDMMRTALAHAVAQAPGPVVIVHGGARGADELAAALTPGLGPRVSCEPWPADWDGPCRPTCAPGHRRARKDGQTYCPAAGAYRNQRMVKARADLVLAFPLNDSPGTRDCMRRATAAGIPVINVPVEQCAPLYSTQNRATQRAYSEAMRTSTRVTPPRFCGPCAGWHLAAGPAPAGTRPPRQAAR